ncbi:MAG: hypothetical protein V7636_55 [Actinomycetota bacterium]
MTRRLLLVAALAVAIVLGNADPASAHAVAGVAPTNYRSELTDVAPAYAWVHVTILDLGRRIRLTNTGAAEITVLGYDNEPYLRVGPDGVFENLHSPARYLNQPTKLSPTTPTTLPNIADPTTTPQWRKVSSATTVTWRDRRTRWEGSPPRVVTADEHRSHVAATWTIPLRYADSPMSISGRIVWEPPPRVWPVALVATLLFALTLTAALTRRWATLLRVALATVVAVDVVQAVAAALARHDASGAMVRRIVLGGFVDTVAWLVAIVALGELDRRTSSGVIGAGVAGLAISGVSGYRSLATLTHSQVPSVAPAVVARFAVGITLGLGVGLGVATLLVIARGEARATPSPITDSQ